MILWSLLPDELLCGYISRLRNVNLLRKNDELALRLGIQKANAPLPGNLTPLVQGLLAALEMDARTLVCQHSLVPLTKCVATFDTKSPSPPDFGHPSYLRFAPWGGEIARLCRDCVSDDLNSWGFSYWRRSHHLPGITWCTKHSRPLSEFKRTLPFDQSPNVAMASSCDLSQRAMETALSSPLVRRYADVIEALLNSVRRPVHSACIAAVVRAQAMRKGLRVMRGQQSRYLSDEARERLPKRWLREHFPASTRKKPGEFAAWIDQSGHARTRPAGPATFALALSLLWDTPAEGINAFLSARPETVATRTKCNLPFQVGRQVIDWKNISALKSLWIKHRGCHVAIAKEVGLKHVSVSSRLRSAGLPGLGRRAFARAESAIDAFIGGQSLAEACKGAGVEVWQTQLVIRAKGVRGHGEGAI